MSPIESRFRVLNSPSGRLGLTLVSALALLAFPAAATAQVPLPLAEPVTGVEEVWQLVLIEPDGGLYSPQFTTVMSPTGDLDTFYVQVSWNYREFPDFVPGGYQVQGWSSEALVRTRNDARDIFMDDTETTRWVQVMAVSNSSVGFAIFDGVSTTWGLFGGQDTVIHDQVGIASLDNYSPEVSVRNSCITYGANRVALLMITEVRYYGDNSGLLYVDTTPRVAYAMNQGD